MFNFFQKPFGLDISDYSIEVISLSGSIENPKLSAMGRIILEPGILEDGKILKKEKLEMSLKDLIENPQFGEIQTRKAIFSLPESKVFVHFFELPEELKKEEEIEKIKSEAKETFPCPLEELYYDFQIYQRKVLLIAAPKKIVEDYLDLFKNLKIQPLALEIESLSLARSLVENKKEIILIVDVGKMTTNFSLFQKKELRLSISTPIAGNKFNQEISERLKISFEEAENLKIEVGLNPEKKEGRIFLILQKEIQGLIEEIRKIEKYLQEKEGKKIEKIILVGGSATLPNLPEYLSENLEKEVSIGDPWLKINIDILKRKEYFKKASEINPIFYSTAIGLALRGLTKDPKKAGINLIRDVKY